MDCLRNPETQRALLGAVINDPRLGADVAALDPDVFTQPDTRAIHAAICRIIKNSGVLDAIAVATEAQSEYPQAMTAIMGMIAQGLMPAAGKQYITDLLDCHRRRVMVDVSRQLSQGAVDPATDIDSASSKAIEALRHTDEGSFTGTSLRECLIETMESFEHSDDKRCYTGIPDLDRIVGGFRGGKLVVLGARPGVGKTALALNIVLNVARRTGRVLMVSLEMDRVELTSRLLAHESKVDVSRMEHGNDKGAGDGLTDQDYVKINEAMGVLDNLPHEIRIATTCTTPLQVRRAASAMAREQAGLALICIDYLQLMRSNEKHNSRYEEVSEISRELKLMAQDIGVPVLALTQFNRSSEAGQNGANLKRAPSMAEAKDSGSIEQDANLFMIQYAPPQPENQDSDKWQKFHFCAANGWEWQVLIIAKNRQGKTGMVDIAFDKPKMNFSNFDVNMHDGAR